MHCGKCGKVHCGGRGRCALWEMVHCGKKMSNDALWEMWERCAVFRDVKWYIVGKMRNGALWEKRCEMMHCGKCGEGALWERCKVTHF